MIGLKKRDIKKALKAGAKAGSNNVSNYREYNRILIIAEEKEFPWNRISLLEQQGKTYKLIKGWQISSVV